MKAECYHLGQCEHRHVYTLIPDNPVADHVTCVLGYKSTVERSRRALCPVSWFRSYINLAFIYEARQRDKCILVISSGEVVYLTLSTQIIWQHLGFFFKTNMFACCSFHCKLINQLLLSSSLLQDCRCPCGVLCKRFSERPHWLWKCFSMTVALYLLQTLCALVKMLCPDILISWKKN